MSLLTKIRLIIVFLSISICVNTALKTKKYGKSFNNANRTKFSGEITGINKWGCANNIVSIYSWMYKQQIKNIDRQIKHTMYKNLNYTFNLCQAFLVDKNDYINKIFINNDNFVNAIIFETKNNLQYRCECKNSLKNNEHDTIFFKKHKLSGYDIEYTHFMNNIRFHFVKIEEKIKAENNFMNKNIIFASFNLSIRKFTFFIGVFLVVLTVFAMLFIYLLYVVRVRKKKNQQPNKSTSNNAPVSDIDPHYEINKIEKFIQRKESSDLCPIDLNIESVTATTFDVGDVHLKNSISSEHINYVPNFNPSIDLKPKT